MTWLKVKEVAELLGMTERAIRWGATKKNKYEYRHVDGIGQGGKQLEIALESLPQEAQNKYNNVQEEVAYKEVTQFTGKQREEANFKALIVEQYKRSQLSPDDFVKDFNERNPDSVITKSQLFRWQRKYKSGDVADLIDMRGGHNRGQITIPPDAWEYFYALYMTLQKRSVQRCWELTRLEYPNIPTVSTFERNLTTIPKLVMIYYREGEKAFNDALVSMERSREDIASNDIWFSDHHLVDVAVINNRGKVFRPWLTVFFDARASKVISFIVRDKSADATVIKQCLRLGIEKYGVPKELYFDNGKDYREKSFNADFPISLVKQLGINMIYATPYHGQAKTVERFFGTMEDRFCKLLPTYLGKDAKQRPEDMRVTFDKLKDKAPTMEQFIKALENYFVEYNNTSSGGIDMNGKCPEQVYYENLHTKTEVKDKSILRILCGTFDERIVQKNGVQYQGRFYYHTELLAHQGEKVIINADPYNMDELNIFDTDMRAICKAPAKVRTPFRHTTQEQIREAMKEKKEARKMIQRYAPTRELDTMSIIARNQLLEKQYEENAETKVIENINPALSENSRILNASTRTRRTSTEESVTDALMQAIGG